MELYPTALREIYYNLLLNVVLKTRSTFLEMIDSVKNLLIYFEA